MVQKAGLTMLTVITALSLVGCTPPAEPPAQPESDWLAGLLIDEAQVNQIMGTTGIRQDIVFQTLWQTPDGRDYQPIECIAAIGNAMAPAYRDSGDQQAREVIFSGESGLDISLAVVSFGTAAQAGALVTRTVSSWQHCAGRKMTISYVDDVSRAPEHWSVDSPQVVTGVDVTMLRSVKSARRGVRAIRTVDNVVVDVRVSGTGVTEQQVVALANSVVNRNQL